MWDSSDFSELEFDDCHNSAVFTGGAPPEVCDFDSDPVGNGILFSWAPMSNTDVFNLYRGTLRGIGQFFWDETASGFGGPFVAYDHVAHPNTTEIGGACTITGSLESGSSPCGIGCECDPSRSDSHLEYLDEDEPEPPMTCEDCTGWYYLLSGERNCITAGEGLEGTLGFDSLSNERPNGGGECPPM